MAEYTNIKSDSNIKLDDKILNFLTPKYIFLPIKKNYKLKVKDHDYVYKNDIVMYSDDKMSIHSSVSGYVLGVKDMLYYKNNTYPSIVIENDFKENIRYRKGYKKTIDNCSLKDFCMCLNDNPIYDDGEFVLSKFKNKKDILVINGIELEPYFGNKYFYIKDNTDVILETIDLMSSIFKFKKTYLVLNSADTDIINEFLDYIGIYPNIEVKLIDNIYPYGCNTLINKKLKIDGQFINVTTILNIYEVLKSSNPVTEKLITIAGNGVKPSKVVRVKIGSLLSEAFINNFDFSEMFVDVYLNGIIHGYKSSSIKYVIDSSLYGVIINKKVERQVLPCSNCGLCYKCCPMKLDPKYALDRKNKDTSIYKDKCLKCGLCNYACPSNIDLMKVMGVDDEE